MQHISATDGKQCGILESSPKTDCEVMQEMKQVIENHRQSFLPKTNAFLPSESNVDSSVIRSNNYQRKRKKVNRLIPVHEKQRKKAKEASTQVQVRSSVKRIEQQTVRSCSFCGSRKDGETRITQCPKKRAFTTIAVEHTLGGDGNGFKHLCLHLEHSTTFRQPDKLQHNLLQTMRGRVISGKHIFIYNVWKSETCQQQSKIDDLCFEFGLINKSGMVGLTKYQMHGQGFYQMLTAVNQLTRKTFVYDSTKYAPAFVKSTLVDNSIIEENTTTTELPQSSQLSQAEGTIDNVSQSEFPLLSLLSHCQPITNDMGGPELPR